MLIRCRRLPTRVPWSLLLVMLSNRAPCTWNEVVRWLAQTCSLSAPNQPKCDFAALSHHSHRSSSTRTRNARNCPPARPKQCTHHPLNLMCNLNSKPPMRDMFSMAFSSTMPKNSSENGLIEMNVNSVQNCKLNTCVYVCGYTGLHNHSTHVISI